MTDINKELYPFDKTIADLEAVRLFLGLELEKCEESLKSVKKARIRRIKQLEAKS